MGKASTPIQDLPDDEISNRVLDDIRDIISVTDDGESSISEQKDTESPEYYKDIINTILKYSEEPFIVFIIVLFVMNETVASTILNAPYINNYSQGVFGNVLLALVAAIIFFITRYMMKGKI